MKLNVILSIGCMSLFAVSCAHKPLEKETPKITQENPTVKPEISAPTPVAKAEERKGDLSLTCVLDKDSRILTLQKGDKRCEVHYTKSGNLNSVAWGEKTPSICDNVFDNVRNNIEKGGFKCTEDSQKTAANGN